MNSRGQSMILFLVTLPVLLTVAGVAFRGGQTALTHHDIQNICDRRALDAAKIQAQGLGILGKINGPARTIIIARRIVDVALAVSIINPLLIPELLEAKKILKGLQKVVQVGQKAVRIFTWAHVQLELASPLPKKYQGKVSFTSSSKKLLIEDEEFYEDEVGAPQQLKDEFEEKQHIQLNFKIQTEKFLIPWMNFQTLPAMNLVCESKVEMKNMGDKWEVRLVEPKHQKWSPMGLIKDFLGQINPYTILEAK